MGRGTSKPGGGGAYQQAVKFIKKNGIPKAFYNQGEENEKAIYKAIDEYGKLTDSEKTVYNSIKEDKERQTLWYGGRLHNVKGYSESEIRGLKKFWAHSVVTNRR